MSPTISANRVDPIGASQTTGALRFNLWVELEVTQTPPPPRDALGSEAHRLEAMAFWHVRQHPACIRYDSRRNLMDDNPASG